MALSVLPLLDVNVQVSRLLGERLTTRFQQNAEHLIQSYEVTTEPSCQEEDFFVVFN